MHIPINIVGNCTSYLRSSRGMGEIISRSAKKIANNMKMPLPSAAGIIPALQVHRGGAR